MSISTQGSPALTQWKKKHWVPLESNPIVFTDLLNTLGVSSFAFTDVLSISDPDLLVHIPRPAAGLVFIFPAETPSYKKDLAEYRDGREEYTGSGEGEDVLWFKQTIGNACGFFALLHAVANGPAREHIKQDSTLSRILTEAIPLTPTARTQVLENSDELEKAFAAAAIQGDSAVPPDPEIEAGFAYIALVKSPKNKRLYKMAGFYKGPVDTGVQLGEDEDLLSEKVLDVIREYIDREKGDLNFNLLALCPSEGAGSQH